MKWFAIEIDRCFKTGLYGNGIEIYIEEKTDNFIKLEHGKIKSAKYTEEENLEVEIKFSDGEDIKKLTLNEEPDHTLFENTVYKDWNLWDKTYGIYDEDRCDYEPWCYNSRKSIGAEMNVYDVKKKGEKIQLYWNKPYFAYF